MKTALVCGGSGFLGSHLIKRLKADGYWVRSIDRKHPEFEPSPAHQAFFGDLRHPSAWVFKTPKNDHFDEVYQLACDMGGMGFLGDSKKDAEVMAANCLVNLRTLEHCTSPISAKLPKVFFASSACVYRDTADFLYAPMASREQDAYPAQPDLEYGWEKLFSERLYLAHAHRYDLQVRIARFHNVFGPLGTWTGGREKAPAAICRKVAESWGEIEIWGYDGKQTRSFLYVDEAIEGVRRLMESDFQGPVNIGSSEMVTIDDLVDTVSQIAGKNPRKIYVPGPTGVRRRNSDNTLIKQKLGWMPSQPLAYGLRKTYAWIEEQVKAVQQPALTKATA